MAVPPFYRSSYLIVGAALSCCILPHAQAQGKDESNRQGYQQLVELLSQQITILQGITDGTSAAAAIGPLKTNKAEQKALSQIVSDEQSFSLYVLRDDARKMKMNHLLLQLTVELQRLSKAQGFEQPELQEILAPVTP